MLLWVVVFTLLVATLGIANYIWRLKYVKGKTNCAKAYKNVPLVYEGVFRQCEKEPKLEDKKDAVDEHLDKLSTQLGLTEGEVRTTRCKIRQTKEEMSNMEALDDETKNKYMQLIDALRDELDNAQKESRLLQSRIEKIVQKRVALGDQSSFTSLHRHSEPSKRQAHPTESLIKIWTNTNAFLCSNEDHHGNMQKFNYR